MFSAFIKFLRCENGFTAIEYGLVITMTLILTGQFLSLH
jgi:Flp pilus assembly pilin Flp